MPKYSKIIVINVLYGTHGFEQAAISPDGKKVAWVEIYNDKEGVPTDKTGIYVSDAIPGAEPQRITAGNGKKVFKESDLSWSRDSKQIAFLSNSDKSGEQQLYVADVDTEIVKKITDVNGFLASPKWSPDGKKIAFLFSESATGAGPQIAKKQQVGEIKEVVTEQRLSLVDITTNEFRQISPADMYIYEYDWSPDGKTFAAIAAKGNGNENWWIAQLYIVDAENGSMKSIYKPSLQLSTPTWSPDGNKIAFIEGLMSDEIYPGGDIYTISNTGEELKNQTPGTKSTATKISWLPDGKKILFSEIINGESGIATVEVTTNKIETLWKGAELITSGEFSVSISLANDGITTAATRQSFSIPPEVWAGTIGNWKQITKINEGLKPAWGEVKNLNWKSDDFTVQGWLLYPKNFDPSKKYPMVVDVHQGPAVAILSFWPGMYGFSAELSARDYFVFYPNPRGSFGQGEDFVRANVKDLGYGDFRDIMKGVDEAIKIAPIDPDHLGLMGWSYGGYMTMWAMTQTTRFKAGVAGPGIANWQSYYGQSGIEQIMITYFGNSVYDNPAIYAKSSPINFIKNVKTPTLLLVGDSDIETPAPQSWEYWRALRRLGIESTLVVYENEGHWFFTPEHQRDVVERTVKWFDKYLK